MEVYTSRMVKGFLDCTGLPNVNIMEGLKKKNLGSIQELNQREKMLTPLLLGRWGWGVSENMVTLLQRKHHSQCNKEGERERERVLFLSVGSINAQLSV